MKLVERIGLMNGSWDSSISEAELASLVDEDAAWFKEELGLSRADLERIVKTANEIEQELKPNDDLLDLTYDSDVHNWYISFARKNPGERWRVHIYRKTDTPERPNPAAPGEAH